MSKRAKTTVKSIVEDIKKSPFLNLETKYYLGKIVYHTPYFLPTNFHPTIISFRKLRLRAEEDYQKIIKDKHIRFFDEFVENSNNVADIEDLFDKDEYLKYFNLAFAGEYQEIKVSDLDNSMPTILKQINKVIGKDRFNHYRPANKLNQLSPKASDFSKKTLDRYEKIFIEINKLY